jgi:maltose alpha-D-glucosyltransferase/alpha-amylase
VARQNSGCDFASGITILYLAHSAGGRLAVELKTGIGDLLSPSNRSRLEAQILPGYLKTRRWFASKDQEILSVRLAGADLVAFGTQTILFSEIEVNLPAKTERYQLPLGLHKLDPAETPFDDGLKLADATLGSDIFVIIDAFELDVLASGLLQAMHANAVLKTSEAEIHCSSRDGFSDAVPLPDAVIKRLSAEQSNSSLVFGSGIIMKLFRRVMEGVNPEVEMIRYLTRNHYSHTPPLLGEVQHVGEDGSAYTMYVAQKFIPNQGDGWKYTLDVLNSGRTERNAYRIFVEAIGTRLAELHNVLSCPTEEAAFAPLEAAREDVEAWAAAARQQLNSAFKVLENSKDLSAEALLNRDNALSRRNEILNAVTELAKSGLGSLMTRVHGDFHLGQVLVSDGDAFIIDFEGEPAKALAVRRAKSSPMRDVAGLLRSLDYAVGVSELEDTQFGQEMSEAFLLAYQEVLEKAHRRWVANDEQQMALLDLFLLEKCAYEICYEAANRPVWLAIPLGGLVKIMSRILRLPEIAHA